MLNHKNKQSSNRGKPVSRHNKVLCAIIMASFMAPLPVLSAVYKWVDEQGKVHYGSQKPEDTDVERIKIDTPAPYRKPGTEEEKTEPGDKGEEQKAEPEAANPEEQLAPPPLSRKEKKRLCDSARKRVAIIESSRRLRTSNEQGNVRYLSDAERLNSLKQARADVAKYCR